MRDRKFENKWSDHKGAGQVWGIATRETRDRVVCGCLPRHRGGIHPPLSDWLKITAGWKLSVRPLHFMTKAASAREKRAHRV